MSLTTYLYRCKRENACLLFWLLLNSLCVFANGLLSAQALTSLVAQDTPTFLRYISLNFLVYLVWMIQIKQIAPVRERALQAMNREMRRDILQGISQSSYQKFHQETAEVYTSWLTNDISSINDLGFETLELMLSQVLNLLFSAVTLMNYHPSFIISISLLSLLMGSLPKRFEALLAERALLFSQKNELLLAAINHSLKGYDVLFGAGRLSELVQRVAQPEADYAASRVSYQRGLGQMMASQNGLSFISQLTILAQAGLLFALGLVPIGAVSSSPYFASVTFAGLTGFLANWSEVKSIKPIFDKFNQLPLTAKKEEQGRLTFEKSLTTSNLQLNLSDQVCLDLPAISLKKGGRYQLVGASGTGKSTFLKLLSGRLAAQTGQIFLDNQPITSEKDLQGLVSLVQQDSFIFSDTLRYNLTLGQDLTDDHLLAGIADFALTELLEQLPAGLDSLISQDSLSGGQAQRICLLRAVLEDKPLLFLDEATTALDTERANRVKAALERLTDRTLLIVDHHMSLEQDNLILLDQPSFNRKP